MQPLKYLDEMLPWNDRLQMLECISARYFRGCMAFSLLDSYYNYQATRLSLAASPLRRGVIVLVYHSRNCITPPSCSTE